MRLNQILAARLSELKDARPDLDTQEKIRLRAAELHYTLSQSTAQRILSANVHTSLDIVEQLAEVFGVPALELLRDKSKAADPLEVPASYEERELLKVWRMCSEESKHQAMAFMAVSAQTKRRRNDAERSIDVDHSSKVPRESVAAHQRAAGEVSAQREKPKNATSKSSVSAPGPKTRRKAG